jgi:hypothetical protein
VEGLEVGMDLATAEDLDLLQPVRKQAAIRIKGRVLRMCFILCDPVPV